MARTYEEAISRLSALQSNLAIQTLFAPQPDLSATAQKTQDLNALAIPEMLAWVDRSGLSATSDLARLNCIHVAGTKGKGSVCAYLTSILTQPALRPVAGRVGTYTSPHLVSVRERILLDGQPISRDLFARYFFDVWDAFTASARAEYLRQKDGAADLDPRLAADLAGPATKPFYFRFLTILAFHVFLREGVRSAVVECGIGGEHDSTNVLPAAGVTAGVVAQLGIDHVGMLGRTLPEIAWHKIGIAKAGRRVFTRRLEGGGGGGGGGGDSDGSAERQAMDVMRARARDAGAALVEVRDADVDAWGGVRPDPASASLEGPFQKYNQALAVAAAAEHLSVLENGAGAAAETVDLRRIPDAFLDGLRQARLRGRCETRHDGDVTWLVDGAHTAESLREVAGWFTDKIKSYPDRQKVLIFNQQERDVGRLLGAFHTGIVDNMTSEGSVFDLAIFTRNDLESRTDQEPERDLSVQKAAVDAFNKLYPNGKVLIVDNTSDAVREARSHGPDGQGSRETVVLVTGSLHLVGAMLRTLEPEALI